MRTIAGFTVGVLCISLLALSAVWAYAEIGRAQHGSGFGSLTGIASIPAGIGFAAMWLSLLCVVALVILSLIAIARDLRRTRDA